MARAQYFIIAACNVLQHNAVTTAVIICLCCSYVILHIVDTEKRLLIDNEYFPHRNVCIYIYIYNIVFKKLISNQFLINFLLSAFIVVIE